MRPNWRNGGKAKALENAGGAPSEEVVVAKPSGLHNPKDATASLFFDIALEFVHACSDVWPQDELIKTEYEKLKACDNKLETGKKLAADFHALFKNDYDLVVKKDPKFFGSAHLNQFKAASKYASSPQSIRDTVWDYLKNLVQYSGMVDMYSKCPQRMLDSISGIANGMIEKLQNGQMDMNNLNPMQLGQMMMNDMKSEDLEKFGTAIMESGNMESMMNLMQSSMAGMGGMPDLSQIAKMMPK